MIRYFRCLLCITISHGVDLDDASFVARSQVTDNFLGGKGGRLLAESKEDLNDFRVCRWNDTNAMCTADTNKVLNSVDPTSVDTALIQDITRMLACSSYGQNSTECSTNKFCQADVNGTCRTSNGPDTLRPIYAAIQPSIQQCGWLGEFFNGFACKAYNLSECSRMGCKITREVVQNKSGVCEEQTVCDDDMLGYVLRLCSDVPGWSLAQLATCLGLKDAGQMVNCTRPLCPQFASRLEFELVNPCLALKSKTDCLANNKCMWTQDAECVKDIASILQSLSPPTCDMTEGIIWSYLCSTAPTPDRCSVFGRECMWEVSENCDSTGQVVEVGTCKGAPEMLGMYIRPPSKRNNKSSNLTVDPTINLLSRVIVSARTCPSLVEQQCQPADGASSRHGKNGSSGTDGIPMEVIIPTSVGTFTLFFAFVMIWLCFFKKHWAQRKQEATAAAQIEDHGESKEGMSSSDGHTLSSGADFSCSDHKNIEAILQRGVAEHWLIEPHSMDLEPLAINKGSFGEVRRGTLFGNTDIAVKLPYEHQNAVAVSPTLVNEIRLLRRLRHPNVVLFHGVSLVASEEAVSIGIVLEWVSGGDLQGFVKARHESGRFQEDCKAWCAGALIKEVKLLMDAARGLGYLHSQTPPILHRDVKPGNILIETHEPPLAKIADFGLSFLEDGHGQKNGRAGTTRYMAPEVKERTDYGLPADIYSFGCVVLFINNGKSGLPASQGPWYLPPHCQQLAVDCIAEDPHSRPAISNVYSRLCNVTAGDVTLSTSRPSSDLEAFGAPPKDHILSL